MNVSQSPFPGSQNSAGSGMRISFIDSIANKDAYDSQKVAGMFAEKPKYSDQTSSLFGTPSSKKTETRSHKDNHRQHRKNQNKSYRVQ
jgi:hypothetical protein